MAALTVGDLQDQLDHASLATTGIYFKVSSNHRREAYMRSKLPGFLVGKRVDGYLRIELDEWVCLQSQ
jgi:hypothetical protein